MKRFHIHTHVQDLQASIAFYSRLFAAEPARVEADYAKWMLDDPRVNFAISTRGDKPGIDHLGFQTDTEEELAELKARAEAAGSVHLRVRNVAAETVKSKLGSLAVAGRISLQDNADGSLSARIFPRDKSTRADLALSVAQTATQSGWSFDELHTEEGRLDDVFRAITLPDSVKTRE